MPKHIRSNSFTRIKLNKFSFPLIMPRKVLETELKIPKISSNVENTTVRSPSGASASVTTPKTPNHTAAEGLGTFSRADIII